MYRKVQLQSDYRLVLSTVRLKLKAGRRRAQRHPRFQLDRKLLMDHHVEEFQRVLEERWKYRGNGDVERTWSDFKEAMQAARSALPTAPESTDSDWVTEEV